VQHDGLRWAGILTMKEAIIFLVGYIVGLHIQPAQAQTYAITNIQGQVTGYIQQNGNTVNVLTTRRSLETRLPPNGIYK
jgi:hypothetical protein